MIKICKELSFAYRSVGPKKNLSKIFFGGLRSVGFFAYRSVGQFFLVEYFFRD